MTGFHPALEANMTLDEMIQRGRVPDLAVQEIREYQLELERVTDELNDLQERVDAEAEGAREERTGELFAEMDAKIAKSPKIKGATLRRHLARKFGIEETP